MNRCRLLLWLGLSLFCGGALFAQDVPTASEQAASEQFPVARSKKGLQVQMVDDALNLGVQHAAINLNLSQLIDPKGQSQNPFWEMDGRKYHFRADYLRGLEHQFKPLSDRGVLIYLIMLVYAGGDDAINQILLHPHYDKASQNRISAFNVQTEEGRNWLQATFRFLAHRWSMPDQQHGRVVGYIIGNEVNSHSAWANRGDVPANEFIDEYLTALRIAETAVHSQSSIPRIYVSLDHFWGRAMNQDSLRFMSGKMLLDRLAYRSRQTGDFPWHIAYHPYPENLFQSEFWKDQSPTFSDQTPRITFKNLEVLVDYLKRPEMLYAGKPRRIILSEQGFHSSDHPASLEIQAAAYCLAWKKVEAIPEIDAFIYHRHVDHAQEGGLNLGLWGRAPNSISTPVWKKPIHRVFRLADTPEWEQAFEFALPIIGQPDWKSALQSLHTK